MLLLLWLLNTRVYLLTCTHRAVSKIACSRFCVLCAKKLHTHRGAKPRAETRVEFHSFKFARPRAQHLQQVCMIVCILFVAQKKYTIQQLPPPQTQTFNERYNGRRALTLTLWRSPWHATFSLLLFVCLGLSIVGRGVLTHMLSSSLALCVMLLCVSWR